MTGHHEQAARRALDLQTLQERDKARVYNLPQPNRSERRRIEAAARRVARRAGRMES